MTEIPALDLNAMADFNIEFAIKTLQSGAQLNPMAQVVSDRGIQVLTPEADVSNDEFAAAIAEFVQQHKATAVCLVAEAFVSKVTDPQTMAALKRGEGPGFAELLARGAIERKSFLIATVETPREFLLVRQEYDQDAMGVLVFGPRQYDRPESHELASMQGRFFSFFPHVSKALN